MRDLLRTVGIPLLSIGFVSSAAALPYADASGESEALVMAAGEMERTEQVRKSCSEELPSLKSSFGKAALFWRIANKAEIQAVTSFRSKTEERKIFEAAVASTEAASRALMTAMTADIRKKACYGFLALAKEQNQRISDRTPKVSSFLSAYLQRNPLSEFAAEQYDYLMGCAKQAANRGFDYDKADATCACQWNSFQETLNKAERAKFYEMTGDPNRLLAWPAAKKAMESAAACQRRYLN